MEKITPAREKMNAESISGAIFSMKVFREKYGVSKWAKTEGGVNSSSDADRWNRVGH